MNKELLIILLLTCFTTLYPSGKQPTEQPSASQPIAIPVKKTTNTPPASYYYDDSDSDDDNELVSKSVVAGTIEMLKKQRNTPPADRSGLQLSDNEIALLQAALQKATPPSKKDGFRKGFTN